MRIDDDAYLNSENLEIFLRKLDPNVPHMIGSAGFGRDQFDFVGNDLSQFTLNSWSQVAFLNYSKSKI